MPYYDVYHLPPIGIPFPLNHPVDLHKSNGKVIPATVRGYAWNRDGSLSIVVGIEYKHADDESKLFYPVGQVTERGEKLQSERLS